VPEKRFMKFACLCLSQTRICREYELDQPGDSPVDNPKLTQTFRKKMVKGEDPWDLRVFCDTRRMDATNVSSHEGPRNRHSEEKLATVEGRWHR
jgi:hypothetical protein